MHINWTWLVVGIIPYSIKRQCTKNAQTLVVKALFWRLTLYWKEEEFAWSLFIPFIEHLRQ